MICKRPKFEISGKFLGLLFPKCLGEVGIGAKNRFSEKQQLGQKDTGIEVNQKQLYSLRLLLLPLKKIIINFNQHNQHNPTMHKSNPDTKPPTTPTHDTTPLHHPTTPPTQPLIQPT